jgi:hypothetical protein
MNSGITKWSEVASKIPGRIGKQCRERWFNHLDPTINKGAWSEAEDRILVEAQGQFGNSWCTIAKLLPGRAENAVKNRWNSAQRRKWNMGDSPRIAGRSTPSNASSARRNKPPKKRFVDPGSLALVQLQAQAQQAAVAMALARGQGTMSTTTVAVGPPKEVDYLEGVQMQLQIQHETLLQNLFVREQKDAGQRSAAATAATLYPGLRVAIPTPKEPQDQYAEGAYDDADDEELPEGVYNIDKPVLSPSFKEQEAQRRVLFKGVAFSELERRAILQDAFDRTELLRTEAHARAKCEVPVKNEPIVKEEPIGVAAVGAVGTADSDSAIMTDADLSASTSSTDSSTDSSAGAGASTANGVATGGANAFADESSNISPDNSCPEDTMSDSSNTAALPVAHIAAAAAAAAEPSKVESIDNDGLQSLEKFLSAKSKINKDSPLKVNLDVVATVAGLDGIA